jgi:hypothetical protein
MDVSGVAARAVEMGLLAGLWRFGPMGVQPMNGASQPGLNRVMQKTKKIWIERERTVLLQSQNKIGSECLPYSN